MMMRTFFALLLIVATNFVHAGNKIYPKPQKITTISIENTISILDGVNIYKSEDVDSATLNALLKLTSQNKKGVKTYIATIGSDAAKKIDLSNVDLPTVSGAYYMRIYNKQISILAADSRGTFYAIQTLRQLINEDGSIAQVEITDYPDIEFRGVVEGFYGTPWSHRDRISQLEFYGRNKLNTYIYGPKDDPYHSSLSGHSDSTSAGSKGGWREPYPTEEGAKISELARIAMENKVDFVWAIHPGQDIKWNEEDYNLLINKFEKMYELGVRSYAVFFDDISGEGTDAHKQAQLLNRINNEFVKIKGDVTPLIMCPTEYNKSWSNPKPDGYLPTLGKELDPSIQIMWTGDRVCADITMATLEWVNERINRPAYIWWNFPVTDYVRHLLIQGPSYGLDTKATSNDMIGFTSNPMEHAEASKLALFGVADYTWNVSEYDFMECWNAAFNEILPEASEAYRTFAIHSADLEKNWHGYRRDESWETKAIDPTNYTADDFESLKSEFERVAAAPKQILESGGNSYLIAEMQPWLVEFEKLGDRGIKTMQLIKTNETGDKKAIWEQLLDLEMSSEMTKAYRAHKSGTKLLQPFIENSFKSVSSSLVKDLYGIEVIEPEVFTSFGFKVMLENITDNDLATYYDPKQSVSKDSHVGLDLHEICEISSFIIQQGREDDDQYSFTEGVVEYSVDNEQWSKIVSFGDNSHTIEYFATSPIVARYIRIRNSAEKGEKPRYFALRNFKVNQPQSDATITTNMDQMSKAIVESIDNKVIIRPMLEVVNMNIGDYFGVELPLVTALSDVDVDLNFKQATVEYSSDAKEWSKERGAAARYIRFRNDTNRAIAVNLRKFEITTSSQSGGNIVLALDGNLATGFNISNGESISVAVEEGSNEVVVLCKGKININGINVENYGTIKVDSDIKELTITGKAEVRELIFKQ